MQYNNKENRKQESSKYNPYEDLISGYINNNYSVSRERYDTTSLEKLDPEKYRTLNLVFNELTKFLQWNKHDDFNWTRYGYMYPNAQKYLLSKRITVSNKHRDIYPIFYALADQLNKSKEIRSFQFESDSPRGRYGSKGGYGGYEEEYNYEDEAGFEYASDEWNDYDVYMSYFRTMAIYVPSKYTIEVQETNLKWDRDEEYRWRLLVLVEDPSYGNKHSPTLPVMRGKNYSPQLGPFQWSQGKSGNWDEYDGYQPEGGRTTGGPGYPFGGSQFFPDDVMYALLTRRTWSILPHLAFYETISPKLKDNLHAAADKYGDGSNEDFVQIGGRGQTDMSEPGKNNFDPSHDYKWNPFRPDFWSYYGSKYERKKGRGRY